ncbi:hypothetical protein GobsT_71220 [Gemmata obscuriglobus]|uniref:Peptidase C1A papain C-terminal domain-containing protein n=1 Tax=Gemmata obscuriglobus TaxID=114 RepID=A0A2Z3HIW9_9BACT|nr:hypothetical protein [Gemmata obscuriglobus]AWM41774.1 hypothetical protein C1280_35450 [Gemmata obscuriglobus]QEG32269.1 hypothetical protein GobsT_71220 [Gemmata obscuriglobus]VTS11625.1 Uncharacterized protein OS=Blastopirellula marina DSM 3645 GN=DSM3645_28902 PE=4 SV=1 [Gemmata obscuriglobus UQM 2246]
MSNDAQLNPERRERLRRLAILALKIILPLVLGTGVGVQVAPERVREIEKRVEVPTPAPSERLDEFEKPTGWVRDPDVIERNLDQTKTLHFEQTPAGRAALGDDDVFLFRAVRKAAKLPDTAYPNVNQGSVGCCVGAATKHGCDTVQATAIAQGASFEWKPVSVEVVYAGSRIDVGKGQIRGDGSLGRWACEYVGRVGGIAPMERIGSTDLTTFSPARAREWGARGIPAEVSAVARQHPVKGAALVKSAADVKRAIAQGYPVVVCSDVGFDNRDGSVGTRDAQGFCTPRGTWPHAMCFIAWRNGSRPGVLCLNSWGDSAHGGPVWPEDQPRAAFWIDEAVADRMVRQGDSFALSDVQGFPARRVPIDWIIRTQERHRAPALDTFALAW